MAFALAWQARARAVSLIVALTLVGGGLPVATAWVTKLVLDRLAAGRFEAALLVVLAAVLGGLGIVAAVHPHGIKYTEAELRRGLRLETQDRLYRAVNRFKGLARFERPEFRDVLRLAREASSEAPQAVVGGVLGIGQSLITVVSFLVTLFVLSPAMAGLVLLAAVPGLFVELKLARRRADLMWRMSPASRRQFFYETLLTELQPAKEIRVFGLGRFLHGRMLTELGKVNREERLLDASELRRQVALAAMGAVIAGAGLVWAVSQAAAGQLTVGDVSMFVAAVLGVQGGLASAAGRVGWVRESLLRFGHYLDVVELPPDLPEPSVPRRVGPLRHGLELRGVWFRYGDRQPWVLRDIDLKIPHGQAVALVGRNGAGKSTLVKLLCRLYEPVRGAVLWDGHDIRELPVEELRERLGVLLQDFMVYDFTAAENIGLGDLAGMDDRERVETAARLSGVDGAIAALPRGYDTLLSRIFFGEEDRQDPDTGVLLSGGQGQRLALARVLMRGGRDLLILDEPTAGLDAEAAYQIHERLREHRAGRTSLLVSHRLNTVRDADVIVVLDGGGIVERGSHGELMAAGGHYAGLFRLQAAGYDLDTVDGEPDRLLAEREA